MGGALLGLMIAQKSIGAVCPDWDLLLLGTDEKLDPAGGLYINQRKKQAAAAGADRCWDVSPATTDDFLATVAGTVPLALGIGPGLRCVAQWAIMGGFTTSTLLTLVVVPVLFSYVDNFQAWILQRLRHGFGRKVEGKLSCQASHSLPPGQQT